ncbi:A disintegrin and metalloproteinase with thrombospondin motifs 7 isoform X6 [Kogia breviceps]|uniref:A disintegrin and metalloproteinase with thrombospondin motifs 7 isoform X6 n=1 Tax=Kogia breviceps TaxID=27615 RepID=UPI0034D34112
MPGGPNPRSPAPLLRPLLLFLCALAPGAHGSAPEHAAEGRAALDIVHPVRVDAGGSFLSYELWPRALRKRDVSARPAAPAFYELQYRGRELRFNLTANSHLLAPGFVSETRRRGGLGRAHIRARAPACHLLGDVQDPELEGGLAAISACDGLKGVFQLSNEDYFIEPLDGVPAHPGRAQPHVVYKRQAPERWAEPGDPRAPGTCGVKESPELEPRREHWEQRQQWRRQRPRRLHQRSVSKEKWVETLVVADAKMVEYHGQPDVESYVLTIMNMVAGLFHDPSIGNPIHITIVRLVLLEDEEEDLKITHHADNTLRSFCKWQKSINMKRDTHPLHHDTAILLTRKDLCAAMNQPCETLGLSHVAGMCQPHRSCNINEDTGLPLAFTVAHELGHSSCTTPRLSPGPAAAASTSPGSLSPNTRANTAWVNGSAFACATCRPALPAAPLSAKSSAATLTLCSTRASCTRGCPWSMTNVGCDFEIDSGAIEDRCGVCHGNGSTCHTVSGTFEEAEGLGYVDVGLIPAGAREIRIEEVAEAANFLALRSEDPDKYFLNGGWIIQWNGDYQVAGTTFTYARTGNWENLTSPGPTDEPIWIQLLFQESNPGVRYEYIIHREADGHSQIQPPEFSWHYGPWTKCTVTCGTGMQRQSVHCMERQAGPVDERHCEPLGRPDDRQRRCSEEPCPARWWAGEWQLCSSSCGPGGLSRRAVLCIHSVGLDEQSALEPPACEHLPRPPAEIPCNRDVPCPATWAVGNWSECSVTCGPGTQHRSILCTNDTGVPCDEDQRPASEAACLLPPCPRALDVLGPEGSGSGSSSRELFNEVDFIPHRPAPRPPPPSSPKPAGMGNAIGEEDPELGPPGPVFVDDFYYDYNFINFHENLSYGPFEEPDTDLAGTGDWIPPPLSSPAEPPMGTPTPTTEPSGPEDEGALGDWSPAPWPSQAGRSPPPPSEQTPGNSLVNFLFEEDAPIGTPDLGLPSLPWPPTSVSMETPAAPGSQNKFLGGEDSQSQPPPPWWERTNEVSEDSEEALGRRAPQRPSPTLPPLSSISTSHSSPSPDTVELWTSGTLAWEPALEGGLGPVDNELWPTIGGAPPPPPTANLPDTQGTDSALEPGTPTLSTPGLALRDLQTLAMPGTFLLKAPTGLGHAPWVTALSLGPLGQPESPSPETPPSPVLPSIPAQDNPANGSRAPGPLDPSPAEEGPPVDLLPVRNASWQVGNWSECSTTCGLGAVWRPVRCSSGQEEDCSPAARPQPARRCHLRPCAAWHTGSWSKCSRSCGGGSSVRDVQCVDTRDLQPLRPFHCQPGPAKPPARRPCGAQPCLSWYISSWRECSEACGGGEQQRLVTCPEPGLCEEALRPNSTRPCNTHPCTQWVVGPWGQCSAPCGGGVQRRLVKCVNTQTGLPEEDSDQCGHEAWPESSRPCGTQDCELTEPPPLGCERDRLSFGFCETLRLLGRCQLPTVRTQCCRSCPPPGRGAPSRGRQRVARR